MPTTHDALAQDLSAVLRDLVLLLRQANADQPVTSQQLAVLGSMEAGPRRVSALAEEHGVRTSTMTVHVARLEEAGLVARAADDADARAVAISLSAEGARLLAQGRAARVAFLAGRLESLGEAELRAVEGALPVIAKLCARA